jgi:hypothetical protein
MMPLLNTARIAIAGTLLIGSWGIAHAGATGTVDGVTFPLGIVPGGNQIQSGILDETLVTAPGQILNGVGYVTAITDTALGQTWSDGQNGVELAFSFTGYTATTVIAPTGNTPGTVNFSGGMLGFYVLPAGTQISGLGSVTADQAAVQAGTLWLSEKGAAENAAGDTLISTIPTGATLTNFSSAAGFAFLDATGGPADSYLATRTFANGFDAGGFSDESFTIDFSSSSTNGSDFGVSGSGTVKANTAAQMIPEPASLDILGIGMLAVYIARRRSC